MSPPGSAPEVGGAGVGDVQGQVVLAVGVAPVDGVPAFGRAAVAFTLLVAERVAAEGDAVGADHRLAGEQVHDSLRLVHDHPVDPENPAASGHRPIVGEHAAC